MARSFESLLASGLAEASVVRYRASLSAFFGWCVREKLILANPVTGVRVPKQSAESVEMLPFAEVELEAAHALWATRDEHLADVLLVLGWTGLRWAEARALTVGDVMEVPTPGLLVRRSAPEGVGTKSTKGRRSRRVPLANRVLPIVQRFAADRQSGDLLLTTSRGFRLHRSAVLRAIHWSETGSGRRLHDLRHTAACLWLARGVDRGRSRRGWVTSPSRRRTGTCTSSELGPMRRVWRGSTRPGGQRGGISGDGVGMTTTKPRPSSGVPAGRTGFAIGWSCGDSNPGPSHCERDALPTAPQPQVQPKR